MDISKRVVNVESPFLFRLVRPTYVFIDEVDPYIRRPFIYTGFLSKGVVPSLRSIGVDFTVAATSGGELTLTREDFFHAVSKRRRIYDSYLDKIPVDEFINMLWKMRLLGKLDLDEESNFLFELFDLISRKSKDAVLKAAILLNTKSAVYLTSSLLTFMGRVMTFNDLESGAVSGGYRVVLQRASKRRVVFERTLRLAARLDITTDSMRFLVMVRELTDE